MLKLPRIGDIPEETTQNTQGVDDIKEILKNSLTMSKHRIHDEDHDHLRGVLGWVCAHKNLQNESEIRSIYDKIEQFNHDQEVLENLMLNQRNEKVDWDKKFQNYWGYIITSDCHFESTISMCEKMFKHVG